MRGVAGVVVVRPRRARCSSCRVSHVLLPVFALLRRADLVEVIGAVLSAKAAGSGARTIAAGLARPVETVRGWLRTFAGRAEALRAWFSGAAGRYEGGPGAAGCGGQTVRGRGRGGVRCGRGGAVAVAAHRRGVAVVVGVSCVIGPAAVPVLAAREVQHQFALTLGSGVLRPFAGS